MRICVGVTMLSRATLSVQLLVTDHARFIRTTFVALVCQTDAAARTCQVRRGNHSWTRLTATWAGQGFVVAKHASPG